MSRPDRCRRTARILLVALVASLPPQTAPAAGRSVEVTVGQPNVWSLDQAHYLLAKMHERSSALTAKLPLEVDLDPSALHGRRLDLLRSLLQVEASLDEPTGEANRLKLDEYSAQSERRRTLQAQLDVLRARRLEIAGEIAALQQEKAESAARVLAVGGDATAAATAYDSAITAKQAEATAVDGQITAINTELAATTATAPTFAQPTGVSTGLPGLPAGMINDLAAAAFGTATPKLHASTVLDNFVQLQYEIIAKQLTLLRDELGPDERLVFFELPHSIYTVPGESEDRLVRVAWRFKEYWLRDTDGKRSSFIENERPLSRTDLKKSRVHSVDANGGTVHPDAQPRVLDLIPRTSALNLNEIHGSVKGLNLFARFARLVGLGGSASYQRQRERLANYATQDVFAAAFGRGRSEFGWTIAPHPGERRIRPGDKTTYAVAAIPKDTVLLTLQAEYCHFPRGVLPPDSFERPTLGKRAGRFWQRADCGPAEPIEFELRIPTTESGRFFLEEIQYSSVAPGERITVFLRGQNFSPQTGVLINGIPLGRTAEIARHQPPQPAPPSPSGVYEIVNSGDLVLSFSMGPGYEGTPVISLVTPSKVTPINYFKDHLTINRRTSGTSLYDYAQSHPMFRDPPQLTGIGSATSLADSKAAWADPACKGRRRPPASPTGRFIGLDLRGENMRRGAHLFVQGESTACASYLAPTLYRVVIPDSQPLRARSWRLRYYDRSTQRPEEHEIDRPSPFQPQVTSVKKVGDSAGGGLQALVQGQALTQVKSICLLEAPCPGLSSNKCVRPSLATSSQLLIDLPGKELPKILRVCPTSGEEVLVSTSAPSPAKPKILWVASVADRRPHGPVGQAHAVEIGGENLGGDVKVMFGTEPATMLVKSDSLLLVRSPASAVAGPVMVEVVRTVGGKPEKSDASSNAVFTFTTPANDVNLGLELVSRRGSAQ